MLLVSLRKNILNVFTKYNSLIKTATTTKNNIVLRQKKIPNNFSVNRAKKLHEIN